jgi:hypothetical protein
MGPKKTEKQKHKTDTFSTTCNTILRKHERLRHHCSPRTLKYEGKRITVIFYSYISRIKISFCLFHEGAQAALLIVVLGTEYMD